MSVTELGSRCEIGFCRLTTQTTGPTVWPATCWRQMIITPYGSICSLYNLDARPDWFSHMWAKMVSADPVLLFSLVLKRLEKKKGNKLCNEVWRYWCNRLHLNRLPSGSRSNNILPETPLKMSSLDTNWQKSKGKKTIIPLRSFQILSVCYWSLNGGWQQRWQGRFILPATLQWGLTEANTTLARFVFGCLPGVTEALRLTLNGC